jgi:hypothetical protein
MYRGWQDLRWVHTLLAAVPLLVSFVCLPMLQRRRGLPQAMTAAAFLWLLSLFLAREASPESLGIPVMLLGLAVMAEGSTEAPTPLLDESRVLPSQVRT